MDREQAESVIESVAGFTESDTPVGEAWEFVVDRLNDQDAKIKNLEAEVKTLEAERRAVFEWDNQSPVEHVEHMNLVGFLKTRTLRIWEHNEKMAKLETERDELRSALDAISKSQGPYSRDPLEHANNCLNRAEQIARAAKCGEAWRHIDD